MEPESFDRAAEDVGNILELGHVNLTVPDQVLATLFYISGLGFTRDPHLVTGVDNMWVNVGRSQFHLPTRPPQVLRGVTGLVTPDLDALRSRLAAVQPRLAETEFAFHDEEGCVAATCPWGNQYRLHVPHPRFGEAVLGMPYVLFSAPPGSLDGIVRFYRDIIGAPASSDGTAARVEAGPEQVLLFQETDAALPPYDGHHIQITVADFSGPHRRLRERGLITHEDNQHQWRFKDIIDPDDGRVLFTIEHEVRSMRHPLFGRALVNRNPVLTNRNYAASAETWNWASRRP